MFGEIYVKYYFQHLINVSSFWKDIHDTDYLNTFGITKSITTFDIYQLIQVHCLPNKI